MRPTHASQKIAIRAQNSPNLPRVVQNLIHGPCTLDYYGVHSFIFVHALGAVFVSIQSEDNDRPTKHGFWTEKGRSRSLQCHNQTCELKFRFKELISCFFLHPRPATQASQPRQHKLEVSAKSLHSGQRKCLFGASYEINIWRPKLIG